MDTPPSATLDRIPSLLEEVRRRLVETGTRNRLIHVNRKALRTNALNVVNERSDDVFSILRTEARRMRFRALGKDRTEDADGPILAEEIVNIQIEARHQDTFLDTLLGPDALQKRLLRLADEAKVAENEQGVNILYLALGFLTWYEDEKSTVAREAPLILLPVELVRNERGSTFDIRARDDDLFTNLPLQERLKGDFGIQLPEIEESDAWTPESYFELVEDCIGEKKRWKIDHDGIQLGFFSFAKLLMLRDLDPANWPDGALTKLDIVRRLLKDGFEQDAPLFGPEDRLDDKLDPGDMLHVVDADASQTKVIEEVRKGRNLVVQGPPGTGKSQTITNIIAAAVHDGKSVLFMAEKMAALGVVHNRLVKSGLRDVCLELHSRNANKKLVLQELARTLNAAGSVAQFNNDPTQLRELRAQLNECAELLHRDVPGRDYTPFEVISRIVGFIGKGTRPPTLIREGLASLKSDEVGTLAKTIQVYVDLLAKSGPRHAHPFAGATADDLQPTDQQRLALELDAAAAAFSKFDATLARILVSGGLPLPSTVCDADRIADLLGRLSSLPARLMPLCDELFDKADDKRLREGLAAGAAWRMARDAIENIFTDAAWTLPAAALRPSIAKGTSSFFARVFGGYRSACAQLASVLRQPLPKPSRERLRLVDRLLEVEKLRTALRDDEDYIKTSLAEHWRGERSEFSDLHLVLNWLSANKKSGLVLTREMLTAILRLATESASHRDAIMAVAKDLRAAVTTVLDRLAFEPPIDGDSFDIKQVAARFTCMRRELARYSEWTALRGAVRRLEQAELGTLVAAIDAGKIAPDEASDEFLYATAEARWREIRNTIPALAALRETDRHGLVARFQTAERDRIASVQKLIQAKHLEQLPRGAAGEMAVIRGEIAKKRSHKPIRKLFEAAGSMVRRIKPVLLMSPISIAQFLPPQRINFDLLVIDEASQVRPEDALGAVARAVQIVVVGDQKQLPPTSFFDRLTDDAPDDGANEEEEDGAPQAAKATEMESILTLCEARGLGSRMLEWHYRSKDPSLISISNVEFYENRLVLPPSPLQLDKNYGLSFRRVPGAYSSKSRGGGRPGTNRIEAEEITKMIAAHARDWPELSLGVVAFSKAQSDMLNEAIEVARRKDAVLDSFIRASTAEEFFVKNIENVQGDERDVILISIGYGPHEPNGRLASMHFGPVNGEGGERRLNVLFSRARVRCIAVASFDPSEIDPSRASRNGPRVLKRFLDFASSGHLDERIATGDAAESPFEDDVADVIESLGYRADAQVGSAGFRIDIGARHPDRPGQYILAVECDGATWHGALWARERDRLRQDVLENLGWRFHRIWSTDWFHRRDQEIARLRAALESANAEGEKGTYVRGANDRTNVSIEDQVTDDSIATEESPVAALPQIEVPAYRRAEIPAPIGGEPHDAPIEVLVEMALRIIEIEGPIHTDEIARRVAAGFGKSKAGGRIQKAATAALDKARRKGGIIAFQDFWMTLSQQASPPVRSRAAESTPTTRAIHICPLEIRAAAALISRESGDVQMDEMIRSVARLLGFQRVGADLQAQISDALQS
jgi:hypothetical protein